MTTPGSRRETDRGGAGFTLVELLVVVMIITILFGILVSAIRSVQRHTLKTITEGELRNIESAWKQYFTHYQRWPEASNPDCAIDADMAAGLQGDTNSVWGLAWNPDARVFMEFTRQGSLGQPLNAWGDSGSHDEAECAYYVLFDWDGDNRLLPSDVPTTQVAPFSNTLYRSVIVWTHNPEDRDGSGRAQALGSWTR